MRRFPLLVSCKMSQLWHFCLVLSVFLPFAELAFDGAGFEDRLSIVENRLAQIGSRVLSLEYAVKDLSGSRPTEPMYLPPPQPVRNPNPIVSAVGEDGGVPSAPSHPSQGLPVPPVKDTEVEFRPRDCSQIKDELDPKQRHSTVYTIYPISRNRPLEVFCDMERYGGGWTVIQQRGFEGIEREDFNRTWQEYSKGFGEQIKGDYWIGLENIVALTKYDDQEVVYEFLTVKAAEKFVSTIRYDRFKVDNGASLYRLHLEGYKEKDSSATTYYLENQNGMPFSTRDKDNAGNNNRDCRHTSGWWFQGTICHRQPDLNMPYDEEVLHIHKYNGIQDRHGVAIKIRTKPSVRSTA